MWVNCVFTPCLPAEKVANRRAPVFESCAFDMQIIPPSPLLFSSLHRTANVYFCYSKPALDQVSFPLLHHSPLFIPNFRSITVWRGSVFSFNSIIFKSTKFQMLENLKNSIQLKLQLHRSREVIVTWPAVIHQNLHRILSFRTKLVRTLYKTGALLGWCSARQ